jgi:predicted pyridoxine 5'-phosphate oxidase superfamily flavin-nucleotide-binding protein
MAVFQGAAMSHAYFDIAMTPRVRALQEKLGSRAHYARFDAGPTQGDRLTGDEEDFIAMRDGFYMATVNEAGWPYVQFRGGPAGFLKMLDERRLGFADFRGNRQYVSAGNLGGDDRVSLFLMDYAARRRLKIFGHAALSDDKDLIGKLRMPDYEAQVERAVVITVAGFNWNCPQHITPRYTEAEIVAMLAPLRREMAEIKEENRRLRQMLEAAGER